MQFLRNLLWNLTTVRSLHPFCASLGPCPMGRDKFYDLSTEAPCTPAKRSFFPLNKISFLALLFWRAHIIQMRMVCKSVYFLRATCWSPATSRCPKWKRKYWLRTVELVSTNYVSTNSASTSLVPKFFRPCRWIPRGKVYILWEYPTYSNIPRETDTFFSGTSILLTE